MALYFELKDLLPDTCSIRSGIADIRMLLDKEMKVGLGTGKRDRTILSTILHGKICRADLFVLFSNLHVNVFVLCE